MIEVEGPGGVIVEFPDGTSTETISGAMQKQFGGPKAAAPAAAPVVSTPSPEPAAAPKQPSMMDKIFPRWGLPHEIANGMTFGTYPNIEAGVVAGVQGLRNALGADGPSMGEAYDKDLQSAREARRAFRGQAPITAAIADATGGLATGGALVKSGATLLGRMPNEGLSNLIPRMFAGGAEGATYGAVAGFGGSEGNFAERQKAARDNIPLGALAGTVGVPAIDYAVKPAANFFKNIYQGYRNPEAQGRDMLVQSIMRDRSSPNSIAQRVEDAATAGQPEYMAMDAAGKNTQRLNKLAGRTPGSYRDEVSRTLDTRQGDAPQRIGSHIDEATGATGPNAREIERGIMQGRATAADPMYEAAYARPAPQGGFYDEMAQRPSVQQAIATLERTAAERQMPISDVFVEVPNPNARTINRQVPSSVLGPDGQPVMRTETTVENPTIRIPTMRGWDMVKRSLDAQVDAGYRSTDAAQRTAAGATRETRDALRRQLGEDNPDYAAALARYADDSTALNAVQAGRERVSSPSDATREAFQAVPDGQRDLARVGAAAEIRTNKLGNVRSGQDATQKFDTANSRQMLDDIAVDPVARAVLGNPGSPATRSGRLGREQEMAGTRRMMAGGSDTAENLIDQAPPGLMQGLGLVLSGHPIRGAGQLGEVIRRAGSGVNERSARTIGDYLSSNDPTTIRELADLFMQTQAREAAPSVAGPTISAAFNAPRQRSDRERRK